VWPGEVDGGRVAMAVETFELVAKRAGFGGGFVLDRRDGRGRFVAV
jgi:hypothetical protein